MYPFKIIYSTKEQKEKHQDEIYGYANLSEIKKIIYKYADKYINIFMSIKMRYFMKYINIFVLF
jgi:hypothetical protein